MHRERDLGNGWVLAQLLSPPDSTGTCRVIHAAAKKGQMRVHKDGEDSYTAYIHNPFIPLGIYSSAKEAMAACEQYFRDCQKSAADSDDDSLGGDLFT